jgi:hypothetical protein
VRCFEPLSARVPLIAKCPAWSSVIGLESRVIRAILARLAEAP